MTRQHYYILGLVVLFLGIEFRVVDSFVLNEKATNFVADKLGKSPVEEGSPMRAFFPAAGPLPRHTLKPPTWLGWCMMSVGGVLVLHALAMPKQG